ncbi:phosphodiester glycosidase family protein [bacterium]|nr:phosphodiester glycosidase family protein [bacterium]
MQNTASGATVTVNGGYWDASYKPTDLLVAGGKKIRDRNPKAPFRGLFFVRDGRARLADLSREHGAANGPFEEAMICGPVIVRDGRMAKHRSTSEHRRTVIGRDKRHGIFFLVIDGARASYGELSDIALSDGVDAQFAFNLDGGSSQSASDRSLRCSRSIRNEKPGLLILRPGSIGRAARLVFR